jgi:uncharacterized protein (TIGR02145 family)
MKTLFFFLTLISAIVSFSQELEDKRDGKKYYMVTIGTQNWMAQNLDASTFRNGDKIPIAENEGDWWTADEEGKPICGYFGFDKKNGVVYGKVYNWFAVNDPRGLAPEGWHISTDQDWTTLSLFLGGDDVAGEKLKSTEYWDWEGGGTNVYGFSALPGGSYHMDGGFHYDLGIEGDYWTSTESIEGFVFYRSMQNETKNLRREHTYKSSGMYVRCVKDK